MKKKELLNLLENEFKISKIPDISLNGLQVDNSKDNINKIALSVDASHDTITKAKAENADMLFVHHGLFWGKPLALIREHYLRIKALLDADIALFALHLPLDLHCTLGHNAQIAKTLGLKDIEPFGEYKELKIGYKGVLTTTFGCDEICSCLGFEEKDDLKILAFGKEKNKSIAIVSGGASNNIKDAVCEDIDCFITGEHSHEVFNYVKENKINMISAGHYKTETFGLLALCDYFNSKGIESVFISSPTGM